MQLSDDELRDVLARAEEIQRGSRGPGVMKAEMEAVIGAGEAVGLTRPALERALRERFELSAAAEPGSLVFAQSTDDKFYVAEVLSVQDDAVRIRYLRGAQHTVRPEQIRPASFLPGERVICDWPWWGPWTCTIVSYDESKHKVKLSDGWGATRSFPITEIWQTSRTWSGRFRIAATWLSVGLGLGAILGAALTRLIP